jgi:hypothetical protein
MMRFERPVPPPERMPHVPPRLAQQVERYLARTTRIEILACVEKRWERINVLHLDDEPVGADMVGALVKACADAHAVEVGHDGKYRAVLVRDVGELEHRRATFKVELEAEAERKPQARPGWHPNPWVNLTEYQRLFAELLVRFNDRAMDRVSRQRRMKEERGEAALRSLLHELFGLYQEGLTMQADAAIEVTELRVRQRLEQARAQADAQVWDAIEPVVAAAVSRFHEEFLRVQGSEGDAVALSDEQDADEQDAGGDVIDTADEQSAGRKEGAPPSSGDAPSPGKVRSEA